MFSTSGYFKGVNCPYFGSGLCERSYCHFRHVKQDDKPKQSTATASGSVSASLSTATSNNKQEYVPTPAKNDSGPQPKGSLLNMVGNAILQVQRDIEKDKAQINNMKVNRSVPLYKPTPISETPKSRPQPKKPSPPKKNYIPPGVPAYNPTPIAVLNKQKKECEYDPLVNFATTDVLPPQASKRFTLGDAEKSSASKRPASCPEYVPGKKQKLDRGASTESEVEAKFSEEDDEEEIKASKDNTEAKDEDLCTEEEKTPKDKSDQSEPVKSETKQVKSMSTDGEAGSKDISEGERQENNKTDEVSENLKGNESKPPIENEGNAVDEKETNKGSNNAKEVGSGGTSSVAEQEPSVEAVSEAKSDSKVETQDSKQKDGKESEKENKDVKSDTHHRKSDKSTHRSKSSSHSSKEHGSKDHNRHSRDKDHGSHRSKHSSHSSRHRHRSSSSHKHKKSSHHDSRSKERKSSHRHGKDKHDKHHGRDGSRSKKSKRHDSKDHEESHKKKHHGHSKHNESKRNSKKHKSHSPSSKHSSKKRHRHSSASSESSMSSENSSSSAASSLSSISVTPDHSRSSSPHIENVVVKTEPLEKMSDKTEPVQKVIKTEAGGGNDGYHGDTKLLLSPSAIKTEPGLLTNTERQNSAIPSEFGGNERHSTLGASATNKTLSHSDSLTGKSTGDNFSRSDSKQSSPGLDKKHGNTSKSASRRSSVEGERQTSSAKHDKKDSKHHSHSHKSHKTSHDKSSDQKSHFSGELKTYSREKKDRKPSSSPKRFQSDAKSSPRSTAKNSSSSLSKNDSSSSQNSRSNKNTSRASGPTLFEKLQSITHSALFGDDSDGDAKKTQKKTSQNRLKQVKDEVLVISDSDDAGVDDSWESLQADKTERNVYYLSDSDASDHWNPMDTSPNDSRFKRKVGDPQDEREAKVPRPDDLSDDDSHITKKRVAHVANPDAVRVRGPASRGPLRPSAAQVMLARYAKIQKEQDATPETSGSSTEPGVNSGLAKPSYRVAHVPKGTDNRLGHTLAKKKPGAGTSGHTPSATASKDGKRVAHVPSKTILKRPVIPAQIGGKVATNVRQRYLNMFVDECLRIYPEEKDAYDRALAEEKAVHDRAINKNIYLNVAINAIKKLRDEASGPQNGETNTVVSPTKNKVVSHAAMLGGVKATTTSFTINRSGGPKKLPDKFSGPDLYKLLTKYILTEEQLIENGFPRSSATEGEAQLQIPDRYKHMSKDINEKLCCRCGAKFVVFPEGQYARQEACSYHWGRSWKKKVAGSIECRYNCCGGDLETKGCQVSRYHVHEQNRYQNLKRYRKTSPRAPISEEYWGLFALDCEMVYTSQGSELARVTVIDHDMKVVYEALVRPEHPVLDYNTRFSGLTAEDMEGVTTTIRDVQKMLLRMFSDRTILIGHSLESDFIALKLIHKTVVDTSVVFPHRIGPPMKRALRTLMAEYLQKIIQNDVGGHDSKEDAVSCMELMIWKVKQDFRKARR